MPVKVLLIGTFTPGRGRLHLALQCRRLDHGRCQYVEHFDGWLIVRLLNRWHGREWWHNVETVIQHIARSIDRVHVSDQWMFVDFAMVAVAVLRLLELHPVTVWIDVTLTMLSSLFDEYLLSAHRAHETLMGADVTTFGVNVDNVALLPLA